MEPFVVTREDFLSYSNEDITSGSSEKTCQGYFKFFLSKMEEAVASQDKKGEQLFALLAKLTLCHIQLGIPQSPFSQLVTDDSELDFISQIIEDVIDPELQSRLADVLCFYRPNYHLADIAVTSYLATAQKLEDFRDWVETAERLERALEIAAKWGKRTKRVDAVVQQIEDILSRCNGEDPLFLSAKLMSLLQDVRLGDANTNVVRAEKAALRAESDKDWRRAEAYWNVTSRWYLALKDKEKAQETKVKAAETYIGRANDALDREPPSYSHAAAFINLAIEALRQVPNTRKRSQDLHHILLEYQEKSVAEMVSISSDPVDVKEWVLLAENLVKDTSPLQSLLKLAELLTPHSVDQLRSEAVEADNKYIFRQFMPNVYKNAYGKTIARQPTSKDESILYDMFRHASLYRNFRAEVFVEPARNQIILDHHVSVADFLEILKDSPFVRRGRHYIVARGLHAGLYGDFLTATHLLIPQIEDSVRYLLLHLEVVSSGLDNDGIQDEFNLNKMLTASEYTEPLKGVLGGDLLFDMRGLLVERAGDNLRNDMAHGLLSEDDCYRNSTCYLWCLALRFYSFVVVSNFCPEDSRP